MSGGTSKTFFANLALAKVRQYERKQGSVAFSGIATTLLNDGKTAYFTFKLLLVVSLKPQSICSIHKNGLLEKFLQNTSLIIWDECTMSHRARLKAVDRTLKNIRNSGNMMGGVILVLDENFYQTLPVIIKGRYLSVLQNITIVTIN